MSVPSIDLDRLVKGEFKVKDSFLLPDGEAEYKVLYDERSKDAFERLYSAVRGEGFVPRLTGSKDECILQVKRAPTAKVSSRTPVVLSLLTLAAIVAYGWLQYIVYQQLLPQRIPILLATAYVLSLILIIGLHEVAHQRASRKVGARAPIPYFLPGIPAFTALPSFGTVLSHREPPVNRDALFKTGFLGPLVAVILCLVLYAVGIVTAASVSMEQIKIGLAALPNIQLTTPNPSIIETLVASLLNVLRVGPPNLSGYQMVSPLAAAADTGLILTFFNLLPAAQLDGGQLCESVLGRRRLRTSTYLSIFALLVLDTPNYWILAVIVLVIAGRPAHMETLDQITEVSRTKKILFVIALLLAISSIPFPQNLATVPLAPG